MSDSSPTTSVPSATYPPERHILRDLRLFVELRGLEARAGLDVVPEIECDAGGVRAGVLALLVDVVAGAHAARAVSPGWVATCDMAVHVLRNVSSGGLMAAARSLRHGRSTIVVEVEVRDRARSDDLAALATVTFSILEARTAIQRADPPAEHVRSEFALADSGLSRPVLDAVGIEVVNADAGEVELEMTSYVGNSLGALQGGVLAMLIDRAAEVAGGHATDGWITRDLVIHYLSLGKTGPIRARARELRRTADGVRLRVEVEDAGRDHRLLSVATVEVGAAPCTSGSRSW